MQHAWYDFPQSPTAEQVEDEDEASPRMRAMNSLLKNADAGFAAAFTVEFSGLNELNGL